MRMFTNSKANINHEKTQSQRQTKIQQRSRLAGKRQQNQPVFE